MYFRFQTAEKHARCTRVVVSFVPNTRILQFPDKMLIPAFLSRIIRIEDNILNHCSISELCC